MLSLRQLERALDEALVRRLLHRSDLQTVAHRSPGAHGIRAIRTLLEADRPASMTRSEAEERLLELIRAGELPTPLVNARVGPFEVDLLWPRQRLAVEVDGFAFHSSRSAFERDRRRDAALQARGLRVMRITWRQITTEPEALLVRLAQALAYDRQAPTLRNRRQVASGRGAARVPSHLRQGRGACL